MYAEYNRVCRPGWLQISNHLKELVSQREHFASVFDPRAYEALRKRGDRRLTYKAMQVRKGNVAPRLDFFPILFPLAGCVAHYTVQ